jgi:hypothetical protein
VSQGKVDKIKLPAAMAFLKKTGSAPLTDEEFEKGTGVGVTVTVEDVKREVNKYLEEIKEALLEQKYQYPIGK